MKALSIRQPWAQESADGFKTLEFRSWSTTYRGPLLICASAYNSGLWVNIAPEGADNEEMCPLPAGCMLCVVNLVDIRPVTHQEAEEHDMDYDPNTLAWVLEGGYTVVPAPVKGQIKLFDVDDSLIVPTPEGKDCFDYEYPNRHKKPPKNWDDSYE